jgi:phenylacetate-CoA ligase
LPRFQRAYRELSVLEARERWSRAEIEAFQLERLNRIWQHARVAVPYYRELTSLQPLPERFASLAEFRSTVPILARTTLKARSRDFLAKSPARGKWVRTGGSTGEPLDTYWEREAHAENLRGKYRFMHSWGVDLLDPAVYLWGHGASFLPGWRGWVARCRQPIEDWLRNRLRLSAYRMGRDDLRGYLKRMTRFRPASLYAYSTAAYLLAREALATGYSCPSLKLAILTAEPAYPHLVRTTEQGFGVPAVVEYGSIECGYIAGEAPDRTLRVREDHVLLETQPRADGRHDLLVTILNNPSFPLLRYAIGDVTDVPLIVPAQGFASLANVAGRDNDLLLSRSGRIVHSTAVDVVLEIRAAGVRRYCVRQQADGSLHVRVEADPGVDLPLEDVRQQLEALVEGYPVHIELDTTLPATAPGKHRWIHSDLRLETCP